MIVHGTADPTVSYTKFALGLEARCKAVGVPVELHPLKGAGHAPWKLYPTFFPWILSWFHEHLRLSQVSGLAALPGYASPGTLRLILSGPSGLQGFLFLSAGRARIDLGALGVFGLDMKQGLPLAVFTLPGSPGIAERGLSFAVPGGLKGAGLYFQAYLHPWTLTNRIEVLF